MEKSTHTADYRHLRAELLSARHSAGLSQRELAALLDVPHSWIAKVESGERRIDLIECCKFLAACDIDPAPVVARIASQVAGHRRRAARGGASK